MKAIGRGKTLGDFYTSHPPSNPFFDNLPTQSIHDMIGLSLFLSSLAMWGVLGAKTGYQVVALMCVFSGM
jgi:hypothetical protein